MIMKDKRPICRARCDKPPGNLHGTWNVMKIVRLSSVESLSRLHRFFLYPAPQNSHQQNEWGKFMSFLRTNERVAVCKHGIYELYLFTSARSTDFTHGVVAQMHNAVGEKIVNDHTLINTQKPGLKPAKSCTQSRHNSSGDAAISNFTAAEGSMTTSPEKKENMVSSGKNYALTDPSYLKTLGHTHSSWVFGAIAEFVDNSRDAKATKFEISIGLIYLKSIEKEVPMLSVIDDGCGMSHQEILRMISFGHRQPQEDNPDRIGRFGIGFKTGAMALGKDALVLTQTTNSRSIAFLSQSLNEGKDNLEIPIISYRKTGQLMELDAKAHDEILAKSNLKTIKKFSPFDKYFIGEKTGLFNENGTGTQIYIWNLSKWGSNYNLDWDPGMSGGSSFHQGDILIHNKRIRTRPGQMTQMVPLDYSLKSYLQVIFFDPRMKMYVQGAQVQSCSLARSLNNTVVENGNILGRPVQLTLGRNQMEWENANCGIFLYWHGRLIEAYKRVGSMIHNGDKGRGIIGVIEVKNIMDDGCGHVWVHNNKQGFLDCEAYVELEMWLGEVVDKYIDEHVDKVELQRSNRYYKPDNDWVQCDKCRKWRMLPPAFDARLLPLDWFCFMYPFRGKCEMPEQTVEDGVITVSSKRSRKSNDHTPSERGKPASQGPIRLSGDEKTMSEAPDCQEERLMSQRPRRGCRKRRAWSPVFLKTPNYGRSAD
ncbi:unnamed protein product [Cuscuta campestris]|uniref:CW-type domain-containing protein n=1 Tax=Cuscuta campestris TaxID=132261 RepID=A0A484LHN8_9ASTE|nr:unnamed protein product [Cuscuta campestris]